MSRLVVIGASIVAGLVCASAKTHAEEPEYQIVGTVEKNAVSLSILPRAGYRLHAEAPLIVRVDGKGVELPRALYRREDAVDPRAEAPRFELAFKRAARAGEPASLDAELTFYICRATLCRAVQTRYGTSL